ncbi:sensor domain-containing protein [Oceanospirillum sediminis]|uniref:EAL domain-containing protein n=1 Tax=Oceanospirillum sediminis TaxID=2760088 RepID=A0A839ITN8_9GAMM|nr:EAL domain-containing protein [Oceanospirillum sediminis]MBB1487849.1 EAL domain-containing protein [Oceanospirillum sediminis]
MPSFNELSSLLYHLVLVSAGVMFLAGIQMGVIALFTRQKALYLSFATLALAVAGYQMSNYSLHQAVNLSEALQALQWQTTFSILFFPSIFVLIALYSGQKKIRLWFSVVCVISLCFLLLNLLSEASLRFHDADTVSFLSSEGQSGVYALKGQYSLAGQLFQLFSAVMVLWLIFRSALLFQRGRKLAGCLLGVYFLLQGLTLLYGHHLIEGIVQDAYLNGFAFSLLVLLITVSMAWDFQLHDRLLTFRTQALLKETEERKKAEDLNQKWAQVVHQTPEPIIILKPDGEIIRSNQSSRDFWKQDLTGVQGRALLQLFKLDIDEIDQAFCCSEADDIKRERVIPLSKGQKLGELIVQSEAWVRFSLYPVRDDRNIVTELVISHTDVSEQEYSRRAIETIAAGVSSASGKNFFDSLVLHLARLFEAEYAFIALVDQNKTGEGTGRSVTTLALSAFNHIAENITYSLNGTPCDDVLGQEICSYSSGVQALFPDDILLQEMGVEGYIGAPVFAPDGQTLGVMVVLSVRPIEKIDQVTSILEIFAARAGAEIQRLDAEERMKRMAYEDYLTRLPNRARMHEQLHTLLEDSRLAESQSIMMLIDLDHFKTINDALGHDVGDEIIRKTGDRLRERLSQELFISRVGGDEFVVIAPSRMAETPDETLLRARVLAGEILELLMQPFQVGERILNIGGSIGVVLFPEVCSTAHETHQAATELDLLRFADIALYQAKNAGRNNSVIYEAGLQRLVNERLEIERGLRVALDEDQFVLYIQPQVDHMNHLTGGEILIRWLHPDKGMIPPFNFIPVAEETGLILRLGYWIIEHTFACIAQWHAEGQSVPGQISINISAWQFAQSDFTDQLHILLDEYRINPKHITLEITETALLSDIGDTKLKLALLRKTGFRISLDDFGTGYSSLAYLKDLPLDELKIDKAFVDEIRPGERQPLIESMISIGRHMNLDVLAEGVETEKQKQQLVQMGCQNFQGYLFSRPMAMSDFPEWLKAHMDMLPDPGHDYCI